MGISVRVRFVSWRLQVCWHSAWRLRMACSSPCGKSLEYLLSARRTVHIRSLNVPIEHHPTIRYMVYNGYYKVMSNIPKMGQVPTPGTGTEVDTQNSYPEWHPQFIFSFSTFTWLIRHYPFMTLVGRPNCRTQDSNQGPIEVPNTKSTTCGRSFSTNPGESWSRLDKAWRWHQRKSSVLWLLAMNSNQLLKFDIYYM